MKKSPFPYIRKKAARPAFTLAELLIALAILGVIATFTIPKVLTSQQNGTYKAISKEAAATFSAGYTTLQQNGQVSAATKPGDMIQYINYVKYVTNTTIDDEQTKTTRTCDNSTPCVLMHNGSMLYFWNNESFGGTGSTNGIWFGVDPDGKLTSPGGDTSANAPGKMVGFYLYYPGRIVSCPDVMVGSVSSGGPYGPGYYTCLDPPWFNWN